MDITIFEVANHPHAAWPVYDIDGKQLAPGWYWYAADPDWPVGPFASKTAARDNVDRFQAALAE